MPKCLVVPLSGCFLSLTYANPIILFRSYACTMDLQGVYVGDFGLGTLGLHSLETKEFNCR